MELLRTTVYSLHSSVKDIQANTSGSIGPGGASPDTNTIDSEKGEGQPAAMETVCTIAITYTVLCRI